MGFRSAFDLGDFYQRLIANALHGVFVVDRVVRLIHQLEHLAVGAIRVMLDGHGFHAGVAQRVHPIP